MSDSNEMLLQRLFAQEAPPAADPALVKAVIAGVERQRRNARMASVAIGVGVLLATAALAPLVATSMSQAFTALQGVAMRSSHFPLLATALMALASIGVAAWATRS
jgi:hypothetical protein